MNLIVNLIQISLGTSNSNQISSFLNSNSNTNDGTYKVYVAIWKSYSSRAFFSYQKTLFLDLIYFSRSEIFIPLTYGTWFDGIKGGQPSFYRYRPTMVWSWCLFKFLVVHFQPCHDGVSCTFSDDLWCLLVLIHNQTQGENSCISWDVCMATLAFWLHQAFHLLLVRVG